MRTIERLFDFLAVRSPEGEARDADLIVGFGHFDPKIAATCGALFRAGAADRILFTGGIGAGTADLGRPEAEFFADELRRHAPDIPERAVLTETASTNTAENLRLSEIVLRNGWPGKTFSSGLRRVVLVANAYRQRRVWLTARKVYPRVTYVNCPPATSYAEEKKLFAEKGQDLDHLLRGELRRIVEYPAKGYIEACDIPESIREFAT